MALFLQPIPVSLPEGEVGVSASFSTISFSFEVIRGKYLSHTQQQRKGRPFCPFCTRHKLAPWPKRMYDIYRERDMLDVLHVSVGLSQARPNKSTLSKYLYSFSPVNVVA